MNCIQKFINDSGGIENCIGRERKDLYDDFKSYCVKHKQSLISSQSFVRRLNSMYETELKLVTRDCRVTYIIIKKEKMHDNE